MHPRHAQGAAAPSGLRSPEPGQLTGHAVKGRSDARPARAGLGRRIGACAHPRIGDTESWDARTGFRTRHGKVATEAMRTVRRRVYPGHYPRTRAHFPRKCAGEVPLYEGVGYFTIPPRSNEKNEKSGERAPP